MRKEFFQMWHLIGPSCCEKKYVKTLPSVGRFAIGWHTNCIKRMSFNTMIYFKTYFMYLKRTFYDVHSLLVMIINSIMLPQLNEGFNIKSIIYNFSHSNVLLLLLIHFQSIHQPNREGKLHKKSHQKLFIS